MLTNVTLEPMIMFRGSGAIQQFGALYVVSSTDHPFAKLMQAPLRAMPGTVSTIGLTTTITDRRQLQADLCTFKNESFESQYGIEYSKLNCEILSIANDFSGCSVTPYYGLSEQDNLPICTPALLQKENFSIRKESRVSSDSCKYDCIQSDFRAEVTTGSLFVMENVEDRHSDPLNKRDTIVLEMHMKSFDFEKQIQYYDSFLDFLSKIGGWLGLVFGASIISFFEIFYFLIYLLIKLVSRHSP
ncbi:pickpocket protein 28-like [Tigriopus californicus]|uniref:pickpocket protein 28-like n=1 Tax=Tigriopus californicus TaxID=6832 RepID=UPI0027D9EDFD|nr:pickpocket protein 28-like [Tigriopus californicus]